MSSGELLANVAATCKSLYHKRGTKCFVDTNCTESCIKLLKYLQRDEDRRILRYLGNAKILQTDLLPILTECSKNDDKLFDIVLRLLIILTTPVTVIYEEQLPAERIKHHEYKEIFYYLQTYKETFINKEVWEILCSKLKTVINIPIHDREDDQTKTIKHILVLTRNVLQVEAEVEEERSDDDASIHNQVLWSLQQCGMMDLILFIACTSGEQQFYLHVLEIISQVFREQTPDRLASASHEKNLKEKERKEKELLELRRKEKLEKDSKAEKSAESRHSKFGGTFVVEGVKSIGDKDLITHKSLATAIESPILEKDGAKVPKNKVSTINQSAERPPLPYLRFILKKCCIHFLYEAYNPLMHQVRLDLVSGSGQDHDETYYFWAISFFMGFNRIYKLPEALVSETMQQPVFYFVQNRINSWLESEENRKNLKWARRINTGLRAYMELLVTLELMEASPDMSVQRSATVVKRNVFYNREHREQVITLFNLDFEIGYPRSFLKDLVETTHILLKMLEKLGKTNESLIVQGSHRRKPSTKKNLDAAWENLRPELTELIAKGLCLESENVLYDPASGKSIEEQKITAVKKIKLELKKGNLEQALSLVKEARKIWPENNSFGHANMSVNEEYLIVKEIFYAENGEVPEEKIIDVVGLEEENQASSDDSDGDVEVPETVFKFDDFFGRFLCPNVLSAYCLLLESFETNSEHTNYCITKMLRRVMDKLPAMLFQASLFATFQRILKSRIPKLEKIVSIASDIIRRYTEVENLNKKIYLEILFWKTKQEAYEIEHGYGTSEPKSDCEVNMQKLKQSEEMTLVEELLSLFKEFRGGPELKNALEWLSSELQDALEDLQDKGANEGAALVPFTLPCIWALEEDALFHEVLDILSLKRPTYYDIFWRIPAHWNADDLKYRIASINNCMNRVAISSFEELTQLSSNHSNGDLIQPGPSSYRKEIPARTQDNNTNNGSFDSNSTSSQETISPPFDEVNLSRQESPKSIHGLRKKKQRSSSESDDIDILSPPKRFSSNGIIETTLASSQESCSDDLENTPASSQESCSDDSEDTSSLSQESCSDDSEDTLVLISVSSSESDVTVILSPERES